MAKKYLVGLENLRPGQSRDFKYGKDFEENANLLNALKKGKSNWKSRQGVEYEIATHENGVRVIVTKNKAFDNVPPVTLDQGPSSPVDTRIHLPPCKPQTEEQVLWNFFTDAFIHCLAYEDAPKALDKAEQATELYKRKLQERKQ